MQVSKRPSKPGTMTFQIFRYSAGKSASGLNRMKHIGKTLIILVSTSDGVRLATMHRARKGVARLEIEHKNASHLKQEKKNNTIT